MAVIDTTKRVQATMVGMGQVESGFGPATFTAILGSCVAITMFDRRRNFGVVSHIVMPAKSGGEQLPGKSVDTAIPFMLERMREKGVNFETLEVKVCGGASMFNISSNVMQIGQANISQAFSLLQKYGVNIWASDVGGNKGRRILFDCATGDVHVEIIGQPSSKI